MSLRAQRSNLQIASSATPPRDDGTRSGPRKGARFLIDLVVMGGMDSGLQPSLLRSALTTLVRLSHDYVVLG